MCFMKFINRAREIHTEIDFNFGFLTILLTFPVIHNFFINFEKLHIVIVILIGINVSPNLQKLKTIRTIYLFTFWLKSFFVCLSKILPIFLYLTNSCTCNDIKIANNTTILFLLFKGTVGCCLFAEIPTFLFTRNYRVVVSILFVRWIINIFHPFIEMSYFQEKCAMINSSNTKWANHLLESDDKS